MKKFLFVLLAAALAMPMMAQITPALRNRGPEKVDRTMDNSVFKAVKAFDMMNTVVPTKAAAQIYVWDFETEDELAGWSSYDADGDGRSWEIDDYYAYSGNQCLTSRSYYNYNALSPDNWLISPLVPLGGGMKLWARNISSSYQDKFMVYVIPGEELTVEALENAVPLSEFITPPADWTEYTFDLSAFAGNGYFAIRHYDCYDKFRLLIDYITLEAPAVAKPENVTVEPAATTAEVAWEDAENTAWNLRYRETVDIEQLAWDFEDEAQIADWQFVDADGDGFNWTYFNMTGVETGRMSPHSGEGLMSSASYDNPTSTALHPDNWMISPKVSLDGKLSFWAAGQDDSYAAEVFGVFVSTDMVNWVQIGDDITATGTYTEYTFDLRSRAGEEGYFAIRHYNVSDMFMLNIDDVTLSYGEPNEWIVVEGVTNPYTIEGLNPETNYEVEVQGVNEEGVASGWTQAVPFTTLAEEVPPVEPTEKTGAPTFQGHTEDGIHAYFVEIFPTEPSVIYYRVIYPDGTESEWAEYEGILSFTGDGKYRVEAYAVADGKLPSEEIAYEFVVAPVTSIEEMTSGKQVAGVSYYNALGQEMTEAKGLTIVVTTYTDGTTSTVKVVR
mgnify:CR=1 FL=1